MGYRGIGHMGNRGTAGNGGMGTVGMGHMGYGAHRLLAHYCLEVHEYWVDSYNKNVVSIVSCYIA